jgi:hypothetical protein
MVLVLDDAICIEFDDMVLWFDDMVISFDYMKLGIIYMCIFCLNYRDLNKNIPKNANTRPLSCADTRQKG